jgi:phage replication O-like protein O
MYIPTPNFTQAPNDLFDKWLPLLSESELKVLLVILRKTFGWHKIEDWISLSQLQKLTGLSESSVLSAVKSLIERKLIYKKIIGKIGQQQSIYELVVQDSNNSYPPKNQGGTPPKFEGGPPQNLMGGPPQNLGDTKETLTKETLTKEKQQQSGVVVVSELKKSLQENELPLKTSKDSEITKDDVHHFCISSRKNWTPEEIDSAWNAYKSSSSSVSDVYAYIEGIIEKKRILAQNKKNKQHKKEKLCQKTLTQTLKKESQDTNSKPTEGGFSEAFLDSLLGPNRICRKFRTS